jgi:hypothetical protein
MLAKRDVGIVKATRTLEASGEEPGVVGPPGNGGIRCRPAMSGFSRAACSRSAYVDATEIVRPGDHLG